jgi:Mn2+/Fe2+ NRAMP family transporter
MHDCSYWRILLGALLPLLVIMAVVLFASAIFGDRSAGAPTSSAAVAVGAAFGVVAMLAAYLALLVFGAISVHYIGVGQTILYREISRRREAAPEAKTRLAVGTVADKLP